MDGELTEKSCAVLYELVQVTQQARWPLAKKTTVSPAWLVDALSADTAIVSAVYVCGHTHSVPCNHNYHNVNDVIVPTIIIAVLYVLRA